ncbi:MAG: hypothetical protein GXO75_01680 [Calditrichaeota bacterium]|nr:hypothetical protein [Calditrichota bacterium]
MTILNRLKQRSLLIFLFFALPFPIYAQLISIKTVPVATGDQFLTFPSQNMGMGNVSIAVDDSLLDPFVNPAKGGRIQTSVLISAPVMYNISDENGSARTLPLSALLTSANWFGAFAASIQELSMGNRAGASRLSSRFIPLSEKSSNNFYTYTAVGKKLAASHTSIAASIYLANLKAMDGVELLYPRNQGLKQDGNILDIRLGLLREIHKRHTFEILLLHNRFNMTHDVTYVTYNGEWYPYKTVQKNYDHTRTSGLHFSYVYKQPQSGWNVGAILTANRKTHPKIPNYELMNIPRDPGKTYAYNVGIGFAKTSKEKATVAMDFILEPIWSNTWATAETQTTASNGRVIPAGAKTVENDFWFLNKQLRMGFSAENDHIGFQAGLQVVYTGYQLKQYDYVRQTFRTQREHWFEWVPSWGISIKLRHLQIKYMGRLILGTGRPGVMNSFIRPFRGGIDFLNGEESYAKAADILLAPSGALTLANAHVITNQIVVSIPIR